MNALILDDMKPLFKNGESYERFVAELTSRLGNDLSPIMADDQVIGSVLSPEATKDVMFERLAKSIRRNPGEETNE